MIKRSPLYPADIMLPDFNKIDGDKWPVIACDQYTSEPSYWESVSSIVKDAPSTLNLIIPEVYLGDAPSYVKKIDAVSKEYEKSVLKTYKNSMIYLERTQLDGRIRQGIVAMIDLEAYDYSVSSTSLIRATEGTVLSRIPPRVAVRREAVIETPHVMVLIDDPLKTVIEPLESKKQDYQKAYGLNLMLGGGRIDGYFIPESEYSRIESAILNLLSDNSDTAPVLFAVGDGNHSLATAKALYEETKNQLGEEKALQHPSRYALCEVVNLHSSALAFEPIFRVVFGANETDLITKLSAYAKTLNGNEKPQTVEVITASGNKTINFSSPEKQLTVATLQDFLDDYVKNNGLEVDYIHGENSVLEIVKSKNAVGFLFSGIEKSQLFTSVSKDGALPRKTFSMGHAHDKRYYTECRKIK